jgi:uncharacterized protein YcbX
MSTSTFSPTATGQLVGTLKTIFRFPIKSVGGRTIDRAYIGAEGVLGDRQFAFLDLETGNICNAKNPRKFGSLLALRAYYVTEPQLGEELPTLEVLFPDGRTFQNVGADLDDAVSEYLGRPVVLISTVPEGAKTELVWLDNVGMSENAMSETTARDDTGSRVLEYAADTSGKNTFFDLTPLHLITTSTIEHFKAINPEATFDPRRYRPTVVIDTDETGLVEEAWVDGKVMMGESALADVLMIAPRCVMTTLEHDTDLPLDRSTLRTIVKHNTQEVPGWGKWACAGVYAHVGAHGPISVGDPVYVQPKPTPAPE